MSSSSNYHTIRTRTVVSSSGIGDDDIEGGTVKHVRHYQVYRGMSPTTSNRLEVRNVDVFHTFL